jgi:hypothetical protein
MAMTGPFSVMIIRPRRYSFADIGICHRDIAPSGPAGGVRTHSKLRQGRATGAVAVRFIVTTARVTDPIAILATKSRQCDFVATSANFPDQPKFFPCSLRKIPCSRHQGIKP